MGLPLVGLAVTAAASAYAAHAKAQAGNVQSQLYGRASADALDRGSTQASIIQGRGTQTISSARAAAGASGVDIQSGSVTDVVGGTRLMSALDAATTRNNALREAYGYAAQGAVAKSEGNQGALGAGISGAGSLLTGAYGSGLFNSSGSSGSDSFAGTTGGNLGESDFPNFTRG